MSTHWVGDNAMYPKAHVQVKVPGMFTHVEFAPHTDIEHSLISMHVLSCVN